MIKLEVIELIIDQFILLIKLEFTLATRESKTIGLARFFSC